MSNIAQSRLCPLCGDTRKQKIVIGKFAESDNGHIWCGACGASYDSDALDVRAMMAKADLSDVTSVASRADYRKLFVETWEIGTADGDVYTDFDWDDNAVLREGVAAHITGAIRRHCIVSKPAILDVGCGNGFTTEILAREFGQDSIIGIDPSPMIEQLQARTGVRGVRGTLDTVHFDHGQFDVVVIIGNMMLHSNVGGTLAEAHRILKPGGIVVCDFKNIRSASRVVSRWMAQASQRLARNGFVQRNFVNMRYGLAEAHVPVIAPPTHFERLELYDKPPRLLEFGNRSHWQSGMAGYIWRALNFIDRVRGQQAWVQTTLRKHA